jgi:lysophospholipase L1-like esterase
MRRLNKAVASLLTLSFFSLAAMSQETATQWHWVSGWSTAVQTQRSGSGGPPPVAAFENQTIRMVIRPTIGGSRLRIRFSNEFGTAPLAIGSAHLALVKENETIVAGSDRPLTFNGKASVNIAAGSPMLSDPVELKVSALTEVAVSIFLPKETQPATLHMLGQHASYISGPGDFTGAESLASVREASSWFFLSNLEVWSGPRTAALITLGDSITDGYAAKAQYGDWPNQLANRLAGAKGAPEFAVDNEGIGGNRVLWDGLGVSALARFDRDVLSQPGARALVIMEGINDIGWPHMKPRPQADGTIRESPWPGERVTADDLILGLKQLLDRAHEHGIQVFGATITPYEGATATYTEDGEAVREAVNQWIRSGKAFDGVFDFDAAVRDPNRPGRFREELQSGDYLHPNAAGYKAMAASIDISKLRQDLK